jgi:hypothetical protein
MGMGICDDRYRALMNQRLDQILADESISLEANFLEIIDNSPFKQLLAECKIIQGLKVSEIIQYAQKMLNDDSIATIVKFTQTGKRERSPDLDLPHGFGFEYFCIIELPMMFMCLEPEISPFVCKDFNLILNRLNQVLAANIIPTDVDIKYIEKNVILPDDWMAMMKTQNRVLPSTILEFTQYIRFILMEKIQQT